jgi:acyl dehydratase
MAVWQVAALMSAVLTHHAVSLERSDLLYQRLPVIVQPVRWHTPATHGARLDATVALVVLHVTFGGSAIAGKLLTCGKQGWLVALDLHQHVGSLFQRER